MANAIPFHKAARKLGDVTEEVFVDVLGQAVCAVEQAGIDYVLIGGVGSASLGRPRWTHDIDMLVRPIDADPVLEALAAANFDTERTNEHWIFKAMKHRVVVDVIFRTVGDIYLDDAMIERSRRAEFMGVAAQVASPEDQIVIKAIAHDEPSARHWNDALALIAACELDWDYILERASRGAHRVLSLLVYAQSNDLVIPVWPIARLFERIYGSEVIDADGRS
jgi:predicted nucleotidyltransferase